jgi:hypothetical protein
MFQKLDLFLSSAVSPITWGEKQIQLLKCCILEFLEYWTMEEVQNPSNSDHIFLSDEIGGHTTVWLASLNSHDINAITFLLTGHVPFISGPFSDGSLSRTSTQCSLMRICVGIHQWGSYEASSTGLRATTCSLSDCAGQFIMNAHNCVGPESSIKMLLLWTL